MKTSKQQVKRIIIEERGFPWSKWRKVKEWKINECAHEWIYNQPKQGERLTRACDICKIVEERYTECVEALYGYRCIDGYRRIK